MDSSSTANVGSLDYAAIALSGLCLVNGLLLPVVIVTLPLLLQLNATHFHAQLLIVLIPVSLFAFTLGFRRHANQAIIAGGIAGISLLFIGGTVAHANLGLLADSLLTMAGSIVLAASHYFNNRLTRHIPAS